MTFYYSPNADAEIAELQTKLRATAEAVLAEVDRATSNASSIQRMKDLMVKQDVLIRRLEGYVTSAFEPRPLSMLR